jgi:hypothetical protein
VAPGGTFAPGAPRHKMLVAVLAIVPRCIEGIMEMKLGDEGAVLLKGDGGAATDMPTTDAHGRAYQDKIYNDNAESPNSWQHTQSSNYLTLISVQLDLRFQGIRRAGCARWYVLQAGRQDNIGETELARRNRILVERFAADADHVVTV